MKPRNVETRNGSLTRARGDWIQVEMESGWKVNGKKRNARFSLP